MSFDSDVFISYAHIDNQPLPGGQDGWVTVFHEALEQFLSRFKGGNARVWRDKKLRGNARAAAFFERQPPWYQRAAKARAPAGVILPSLFSSPTRATFLVLQMLLGFRGVKRMQ